MSDLNELHAAVQRGDLPKYVLAKVLKPTFKEKENELLVPLVELPDLRMMEATICFHLIKHGYTMKQIRLLRRLPSSWTKKAIEAHIERHGEAEYPEDYWTFGYAFRARMGKKRG